MTEATAPLRTVTLIHDLPESERPRERLRDFGPAALSAAELIAIILRTGAKGKSAITIANDLLREFDGLGALARASYAQLCASHGLGPAKAAELLAAITLGVRAASEAPEARPLLRNPEDIANRLLHEMSLLDQENVRVLLLDTRLRLLSTSDVYRGSVHTTTVRYSELLRDAVRVNASAVVLVHNHPSGDPTPSAADIGMTQGLLQACKLLEIDLHDHIVIGGGRYVSLRSAGLGFKPQS
ncbi:MAG: DNA repair protein RadC [Chloroflexi bacterium]|nr:DNA repair protein RadC [Chloroflexota bacterium]